MMIEPENNETLVDALKAYGLKQDINRIHKEMMPSLKSSEKNIAPVRSIFRYAGRIAAGILFLVIGTGIFIYFDATPENLFSNKYVPYEESVQRGDAPAASAIKRKFLEGQNFLNSGDPLKAVLIFSEILRSNTQMPEKILNDDAEFYLALSYLKAEEPSLALPLLQKIHDNPGHLYHDQVSGWYLLKVKIAAWKDK